MKRAESFEKHLLRLRECSKMFQDKIVLLNTPPIQERSARFILSPKARV